MQAASKGPSATRSIPGPQTPSAGATNGCAQPMKNESNNPVVPMQRHQQGPPAIQQANVPMNRPQGPPAPSISAPQNKPVESIPVSKPNQTRSTPPDGTIPLDSSNTAEHNPPVGFFTARAAESLQKGATPASNVAVFNPHLESPSIRKTAGVDHTKTKPVRTESLGAPPAANPPRTNFVNPQADKTRRVGMPMGVASPLQNRGSYKPPQMKRPADGAIAA